MSYNGWSNYETWNVSLWLNNDEGTYRELQRLQQHADDKDELATKIREFCEAIWENGKTPDDADLKQVDWDEIAESEWQDDDHEAADIVVSNPPMLRDALQNTAELNEENIPVSAFIASQGITMKSHRVAKRPDGVMTDSPRHFRCVIESTQHKGRMSLYFSQGSAHVDEPTAEDVLDCLASDASSYDGNTFEQWARELGYDTDSRKAEKTYKAVKRQAEQLKRFLGDEAYETLLYKTERL